MPIKHFEDGLLAPKPNVPKRSSPALFVILVLAIVLVCGLIWAIARSRGGDQSGDAGARVASRHCQEAALSRLEAPATARFAPMSEQQVLRIEGPSEAYRVIGYVDTPARRNYSCDLHYDVATNTWSLDDFIFY